MTDNQAILRRQMIQELAKSFKHDFAELLENKTRSCINCINFHETNETCLNAHQRPPARIIATGCEQWEEDIPF